MLRAHVAVEEALKRPAEQSLQALRSGDDQQERVQRDQVELGRGALRMGQGDSSRAEPGSTLGSLSLEATLVSGEFL